MAKKLKKSKSKGFGPAARTGMSAKELKKSLARKGGGDFDEEMMGIADGDVVTVTFVGDVPQSWCEFDQHYLGKTMGYRICAGDGCSFCDEGERPGTRTLIPVYVHERYQAETDKNPAKKTKKVGYKYITLSKTVTGALHKRLERRGTLQDSTYTLTREGGGTDTTYDIERDGKKTDRKVINGWKSVDAMGKIVAKFEEENKGVKKKGRKGRLDDDDDDEDDYAFDDDDLDDDDYDDDDDDEPRRKKSKKSKAKKRRR